MKMFICKHDKIICSVFIASKEYAWILKTRSISLKLCYIYLYPNEAQFYSNKNVCGDILVRYYNYLVSSFSKLFHQPSLTFILDNLSFWKSSSSKPPICMWHMMSSSQVRIHSQLLQACVEMNRIIQ